MSEIRATTISDAAGTGPITLTKQAAAKAFASTNAAGTTIHESLNISSLGDTSTGQQLLSFISNMSGSTYMSNANANSSQNDWGHAGSITKSTSQCDTSAYDGGGSYQDNDMSTVIVGDLA